MIIPVWIRGVTLFYLLLYAHDRDINHIPISMSTPTTLSLLSIYIWVEIFLKSILHAWKYFLQNTQEWFKPCDNIYCHSFDLESCIGLDTRFYPNPTRPEPNHGSCRFGVNGQLRIDLALIFLVVFRFRVGLTSITFAANWARVRFRHLWVGFGLKRFLKRNCRIFCLVEKRNIWI